jgi:hypothetical protein
LTTNLWVARDIWYLVMIIGWVLGVYFGFRLGEVRDFESLLEVPKDATIIQEIIREYQEEQKDQTGY